MVRFRPHLHSITVMLDQGFFIDVATDWTNTIHKCPHDGLVHCTLVADTYKQAALDLLNKLASNTQFASPPNLARIKNYGIGRKRAPTFVAQ
jgi:hypothetical protein